MTSKRNRRKSKKSFSKTKQQWPVKQSTRNWLELPSDITANILYRIGVIDILENAQKVCTTWHKICKDPAMWRVVQMRNFWDPNARPLLQKMCMHVVDRSEGQLVDISIVDFGCDELLLYIADRSSQLKRLQVERCYGDMYETWPEALEKFPVLEELNFYMTDISKEAIEAAGRYCPLLKTLKVNQRAYRPRDYMYSDDESEAIYNEEAIAIGENLPKLQHLEIINNNMSNIGLKVILDGCRHLESLDLRGCFQIDLKGDIGKRLSEQIKNLRLPTDSLGDCPYLSEGDDNDEMIYFPDDYDGFSEYDDFTYDDFMVGDDGDDDSIDANW